MNKALFLGLMLALLPTSTAVLAWNNASLPYCNNLTLTTTSTANYTGLVVAFNITNMTGFNYTNGTDVYFFNDSSRNTSASIQLNHVIVDFQASNWTSGYVKLDYINNNTARLISYCYGNLTNVRSDGKLVFDSTSNADGFYENYSVNGVPNATLLNNTSVITNADGLAWINATGAWRELYTNRTYNTSFCLVTKLKVADLTSNTLAFGVASAGGTAPLNAFQAAYPNANWNHRNYITGENSAAAGNSEAGFQTYQVCRNNTVSAGNASYSINYGAYTNYSGAQIINTAKDFRYQILTNGKWIAIDYTIVWFNPAPNPTAAYSTRDDYTPAATPINTIKESMVICFKTQPVCIKLPTGELFRDTNVIV